MKSIEKLKATVRNQNLKKNDGLEYIYTSVLIF